MIDESECNEIRVEMELKKMPIKSIFFCFVSTFRPTNREKRNFTWNKWSFSVRTIKCDNGPFRCGKKYSIEHPCWLCVSKTLEWPFQLSKCVFSLNSWIIPTAKLVSPEKSQWMAKIDRAIQRISEIYPHIFIKMMRCVNIFRFAKQWRWQHILN